MFLLFVHFLFFLIFVWSLTLQIRRANGPGRARSCPWIVLCEIFDLCASPGTPGTLPPPGPDWFNDVFSLWDPPLGPKVNLKNFPGSPLGPSFALEHTPRTLSRPSKKRSGRKMKSLKYAQDFHQNSLPGKLLPIQDPPKWPPMDLINFPEGSL